MGTGQFRPRQLGLLSGNAWAKTAPPSELADVKAGTVSDETWQTVMNAGMRERLNEFDEREATERFIEGFYDGVCAFMDRKARWSRLN